MTLLERLQSHKGGLLRIKSQLFWFGGRGWDGEPGRICLILDADSDPPVVTAAGAVSPGAGDSVVAVALLLIDDRPQWIWVAEADVEVLNDPA